MKLVRSVFEANTLKISLDSGIKLELFLPNIPWWNKEYICDLILENTEIKGYFKANPNVDQVFELSTLTSIVYNLIPLTSIPCYVTPNFQYFNDFIEQLNEDYKKGLISKNKYTVLKGDLKKYLCEITANVPDLKKINGLQRKISNQLKYNLPLKSQWNSIASTCSLFLGLGLGFFLLNVVPPMFLTVTVCFVVLRYRVSKNIEAYEQEKDRAAQTGEERQGQFNQVADLIKNSIFQAGIYRPREATCPTEPSLYPSLGITAHSTK